MPCRPYEVAKVHANPSNGVAREAGHFRDVDEANGNNHKGDASYACTRNGCEELNRPLISRLAIKQLLTMLKK